MVLFLNNDIRMTDHRWLEDIREAVEPGVLVGPLRYDNHAKVDDQHLPYIDGWCLAGMREDLLELGGFDESLEEPAYYSDNLLCLEARAHGMTLRDVEWVCSTSPTSPLGLSSTRRCKQQRAPTGRRVWTIPRLRSS